MIVTKNERTTIQWVKGENTSAKKKQADKGENGRKFSHVYPSYTAEKVPNFFTFFALISHKSKKVLLFYI
jgi:hypothetical protein